VAQRKNQIIQGAELTQGMLWWLIGGADLLSGVDSPFESEAAAMKTFKTNETYLVNLYREQRGSTGLPERYYELHSIKRESTFRYPDEHCYHDGLRK
jgi:hypothetical protein